MHDASTACPPPARLRLRRLPCRGAFTLTELLVALCIVAVLSAAVTSLLFGATNTYRYVRDCGTAGSEMDLGVRRITNNLMEAQTGSIALGTTPVTSGSNSITSATLTTLTQADPANSFPLGAVVSYQLRADSANAGKFVLSETDQRYGTNTLMHNVKTFNVTAVSGVADLYQVDLVLGDPLGQERHLQVYCRN